jgi:hypothetical protein
MAAGHNRRPHRVAAGSAREDIADLVDPHATPSLLTPAHEELACLPIEIGRREPTHTTFLGRAPIWANSIKLAHSRSPLTCRFRI